MRASHAAPAALLLAALVSPTVVGQAAYDPTDVRNLTVLVPGVYALGGGGLDEDDVRWLDAQGYGAVASFRAEHQDPTAALAARGMDHLYLPVDRAVDVNATLLRDFVAWARQAEAEGAPVYAHCAHGWHRAAAFAVAWTMQRTARPYDEVQREITAKRQGAVMRAPGALLAYEAELAGERALTVLLQAPRAHPGHGGALRAEALVLAGSEPAPGATVRVWTEGGRLDVTGTTDGRGAFGFTYRAPGPAVAMEFLHARASLPGWRDGADSAEIHLGLPAPQAAAYRIEAWRAGDGTVHARATLHGEEAPVRFVALGDAGSHDAEPSGVGVAALWIPPDEPVTLRAHGWGAAPAETRLPALLPRPGPPAPAPLPGASHAFVPEADAPDAPPDPAPAPRIEGLLGAALVLAALAVWAHQGNRRRRARRPRATGLLHPMDSTGSAGPARRRRG